MQTYFLYPTKKQISNSCRTSYCVSIRKRMEHYEWVQFVAAFTSFFKHHIYPSLSATLLPSLHIPIKHKAEALHTGTFDEHGLCRFCGLAESGPVLYRDSTIVVMNDINPKAQRHLLVLPRQHIANLDSLRAEHLDLLRHMYSTGEQVLTQEAPGAHTCFGFHVPPRHGVNHLHLHCLALPRPSTTPCG